MTWQFYKEKAESLQSTKNKKKIWEQIAKSVSSDTTLKVTGEQARERFPTEKPLVFHFLSFWIPSGICYMTVLLYRNVPWLVRQ
jgi:hypothetical protein